MKTVKMLEPAKNEFIDAINYYNIQLSGLGFEFEEEFFKTIERIVNFPGSWSKLSNRTRKCRCSRFPYNVIYYEEDKSIIIIALMHNKRKPDYWMNRIK